MPVLDTLSRPMRSLRLSVTDRCNLRCNYCMPEAEYAWLPREDILHFEELVVLVRVFLGLGVSRLRLTGGEPLVRRELPALVRQLAALPGIEDLALTTNGIYLPEQVEALRDAGLRRLTVSLDTLKPERFERLTRRPQLAQTLKGIESALRAGYRHLKLDSVIIKGTNDDELPDLIEYGRSLQAEVRFIEYMDVGGATRWSLDQVFSRQEMLARLAQVYGPPVPVVEESSAPAARYRLPDGAVFGIISSTTQPFCGSCDRSRLTADGVWYRCLYAREGLDLRELLRGGASPDDLGEAIAARWRRRADRGAEERLALRERGVLTVAEDLRSNPHLEMHTRGG
jgi:cyclic pyranopterin phosphate synthase